MHIQTPFGKFELAPSELKGLASAFGIDMAPLGRLLSVAGKWADRLEAPGGTSVPPPQEPAAIPAPPAPPEPPRIGLPEEGFVLDHTGAKIAINDIVSAIKQAATAPPSPKQEALAAQNQAMTVEMMVARSCLNCAVSNERGKVPGVPSGPNCPACLRAGPQHPHFAPIAVNPPPAIP